ncbi:unnamed protein product, partial [Sphacelaria rigidula]
EPKKGGGGGGVGSLSASRGVGSRRTGRKPGGKQPETEEVEGDSEPVTWSSPAFAGEVMGTMVSPKEDRERGAAPTLGHKLQAPEDIE